MNFIEAMKIAEGVLAKYKIDQLKWWKRLDGTPMLNDLAVRFSEAFMEAATEKKNAAQRCKVRSICTPETCTCALIDDEPNVSVSTNQPIQISNSDPIDGDWYWVQKEDIDRVWKWYPAQRQRNHWSSAQFSGIPLHEVKVGAAISSPTVQAKALTEPIGWRQFIENIAMPYSEPINSMVAYRSRDDRVSIMQDLRATARALLASQPSKSEREPFFYINTDEAQEFIDGKRNSFYASKEKKFPFNMAMFSNTPSAQAAQADAAAVRDAALEELRQHFLVSPHDMYQSVEVAGVCEMLKSPAPTAQPQADGVKQ